MYLKIVNGYVYDPEEKGQKAILIKNGKIAEITECAGDFPNCETIDARGNYIVPGFIDIHVHGGGGYCLMDGKAESVVAMANAHARYGTTTIVPTAWTAPIAEIESAIDAVKTAADMPCNATIAGIHLEGPFLSPQQAGAQLPGSLMVPSECQWKRLMERWDKILMVGVAPELSGALEMGEWLASKGIVASIAHSNAFEPEMKKAIQHGYSDVTHLYSGCSTFVRRDGFRVPGVVECALAWDELTTQVIADGKHLPDTMLRLIWKAKGTDRMILITDGLDYAASTLADGQIYTQQNGMDVVYEDGVMKLLDRQAFAGSVATTDRLLRVAVEAGIPLTEALKMLTVNPATRVGLGDTKGRLQQGYDADMVFLDDKMRVTRVIAKGKTL